MKNNALLWASMLMWCLINVFTHELPWFAAQTPAAPVGFSNQNIKEFVKHHTK
jgi:hypothetical protein